MGKAEEMNDKVNAMSAQTEASKLLEQALMQMDGIISGKLSYYIGVPIFNSIFYLHNFYLFYQITRMIMTHYRASFYCEILISYRCKIISLGF